MLPSIIVSSRDNFSHMDFLYIFLGDKLCKVLKINDVVMLIMRNSILLGNNNIIHLELL